MPRRIGCTNTKSHGPHERFSSWTPHQDSVIRRVVHESTGSLLLRCCSCLGSLSCRCSIARYRTPRSVRGSGSNAGAGCKADQFRSRDIHPQEASPETYSKTKRGERQRREEEHCSFRSERRRRPRQLRQQFGRKIDRPHRLKPFHFRLRFSASRTSPREQRAP